MKGDNTASDEQQDSDTNPETAAVNPFLKFAFQSPRQQLESEGDASPQSTPTRKSLSLASSLGKRAGKQLNKEVVESPGARSSKRVKIYHDLRPLSDNLADGLDIIFCGINPGQQSAQIGHHFADPTNHFWGCLHLSGLTSRKLDPREDYKLPTEFSIGLTNLVERPTLEQSELSKKEQIDGVPYLLAKISHCKPLVVCFVGLGIANVVKSKLPVPDTEVRALKVKADIGVQTYKLIHDGSRETLFFAVSSTSGRVVKYQKTDKIQQFKDLRALVQSIKNGSFDSSGLLALSAHGLSSICNVA